MSPLLIAALVSVCAPSPRRCICIGHLEPRSAQEARATLRDIQVLFEGQVLDTYLDRDSILVDSPDARPRWLRPTSLVATVLVTRVWKGSPADTVVVETFLEDSACGVHLAQDESYLIDASHSKSGRLWTSQCHWTRPLGEAKALLQFVEKGLAKGADPLLNRE